MELRYFKHEDCDKNGNKFGSYSCRPSPYGGNECVASAGGGGGMMDCHDCLKTCPDQRPPLDTNDPGSGHFGIMTFPGLTSDWGACGQPTDDGNCFKGINPFSGNKINCVTCDPDEKQECGQQIIASGFGDCVPDSYVDKCCKSSVKSKRDSNNPYKEKNEGMNIIWKYIWPYMIGILLLWLIVWYFTRPKKSKFAVYWRR